MLVAQQKAYARKTKQPYCFEVNEGRLFAFAGHYGIGGQTLASRLLRPALYFTTTPNAVTSDVHDRMPVILDPDSYDLWLDPGMQETRSASEMLKPYGAQFMRRYRVSTRINHVANDDEGCFAPVELAQVQNSLFS